MQFLARFAQGHVEEIAKTEGHFQELENRAFSSFVNHLHVNNSGLLLKREFSISMALSSFLQLHIPSMGSAVSQ